MATRIIGIDHKNGIVSERAIGTRSAHRLFDRAVANGWSAQIIPNANGCTGNRARTDCIVHRPWTEAERSAARQERLTCIGTKRRLGWRGRTALRGAYLTASHMFRCDAVYAQRATGLVYDHDPRLANVLNHLGFKELYADGPATSHHDGGPWYRLLSLTRLVPSSQGPRRLADLRRVIV